MSIGTLLRQHGNRPGSLPPKSANARRIQLYKIEALENGDYVHLPDGSMILCGPTPMSWGSKPNRPFSAWHRELAARRTPLRFSGIFYAVGKQRKGRGRVCGNP